jgi:hypothetical protein
VGRVGIVAASLALVSFVLWPALHPLEHDSLPRSNYEMFAHRRTAIARFDVAVLVDREGREHRLDPRSVGGTDQPMQAAKTVLQAMRHGVTDELCREIAADLDRAGRVEIVSVRHDAIAWFRGDRRPVERVVHAACPSGGSG